jgi:hypothetical protein
MRNSAYFALMKAVIWMGSSKADLKAFPAAVVDDMGISCSWCNAG